MNKPSIPKGTRDFTPLEMSKRNYIFDTIKSVFALYGFKQIETPAMETLQTLLGKYGEEGDKLLFKILNSGDYLNKIERDELLNANPLHLASKLCEKGLRYDLTVPFARFVVMHRDELQLPFKRYQIQPVWRADRPQKGRYREFYQCDADVVGSDSIGEADKIVDITVAIDKLDKIGIDNVNAELAADGLSSEAIEKLQPIILLSGSNEEKLDVIAKVLEQSETGLKGVEELRYIFGVLNRVGIENEVQFDLTLARGLNYYTGAIFEVKSLDVQIGSITGGGRYDNLTGIFGLPGISGVGISFGADRIFDVLNALDLYPETAMSATKLLFINFGEKETAYCLPIIAKARERGIPAEMYPDAVKMKKQMAYANNNGIRYVALAGENEINENKLTLKDMATGEQRLVSAEELVSIVCE